MDYTPAPHVTQNWLLTKPSASGKRGMVVSQVRAAAEAGVAVLDAGGNAIDAAVATALALAAVEPWNSGLGGIGFALVHRAGRAPRGCRGFRPGRAARPQPVLVQTHRQNVAWPVRLGRGGGRRQHPRPVGRRDPVLHRRLREAAPDLGQAAVRGGHRAGHRAGETRPAAGLVHDLESRLLGRCVPQLCRERAGLSAGRPAACSRRIRAARVSSASATCRRRWSGCLRWACATITKATSPPPSPPT